MREDWRSLRIRNSLCGFGLEARKPVFDSEVCVLVANLKEIGLASLVIKIELAQETIV